MIPSFGVIIPNLTGLYVGVSTESFWYWFGYPYFILLSYSIWQGNRYLLFKQREHWNWFQHPVRKVLLLLAANVLYTAPLTMLWIYGWYHLPPFTHVNWNAVYLITLMNVIAVIFITHIYETVFLIKERQDDILEVEQLKRIKIQAELDALKNQVDPHFVFNSLNTLTYLVETHTNRAKNYLQTLADVYRYILVNKKKDLVRLTEELQFFSMYFSLLKIRYDTAIHLSLDIPDTVSSDFVIPPISLQLLLENAVKHNDFSEDNPLEITLSLEEDSLMVSNPYRPKNNVQDSQHIGLRNLASRYQLITGRDIHIRNREGIYRVQLPIIQTTWYEYNHH